MLFNELFRVFFFLSDFYISRQSDNRQAASFITVNETPTLFYVLLVREPVKSISLVLRSWNKFGSTAHKVGNSEQGPAQE